MTIDLSHLDDYVAQVQSGDLSADSYDAWDESGECFVTKAEVKYSQTGSALILSFQLKHAATKQDKEMSIVLPGNGDKHAGRKMGNVGATLYAMMGADMSDTKNGNITQFLPRVQNHLLTNTVKVKYTIETDRKFSEKHGKELVTQYLRSFIRIASVPRPTPLAALVAQPKQVAVTPQPAPGESFF